MDPEEQEPVDAELSDEPPPPPPTKDDQLAKKGDVALVLASDGRFAPRTFEELYRMAIVAQKSGLMPRSFDTPAKIIVAWQTGAEVGLSPMQSVRALYVVGGQPQWMGKGALGLIQSKGLLPVWRPRHENIPPSSLELAKWPDEAKSVIEFRRKGMRGTKVREYTVGDARLGKLWMKKGREGKDTPWITDPKAMLYWRNCSRVFSEDFNDVLLGMTLREIAEDFHEEQPARPSGITSRERERALPPGRSPLLDSIAPATPEQSAAELAQRAARELDEARAALIAEVERRAGGDVTAVRDLLREITEGKDSTSLNLDQVAEASRRLLQHPVFGEPE